jgi:RNA polymerase sigma factor (sigma-70 family)
MSHVDLDHVDLDFPALFDEHYDEIARYLMRRNVDDSAAEDIAQETFLEAYKSRGNYDPRRGTPRVWLYGIAVHRMSHHFRDEQRRLRAYAPPDLLDLVRAPENGEPPTIIDDRTIDARIAAALATLSQRDYEVVTLHCWAELSHQEIADVLGIPYGTVKSRLNRARRQLSPLLRWYWRPDPRRQLRPQPDPSILEPNDG